MVSKKPDLIWRKTGEHTAAPAGEETTAALAGVTEGDLFMTGPIKVPRSIKQLRLFWGLMDFVAHNDATYEHKDRYAVRRDVFYKLGEYELIIDRWGNGHVTLNSIAPENMVPAEFNALMTRMVNLVCQWTGNKPKEIQDHVFKMVADKRHVNPRN